MSVKGKKLIFVELVFLGSIYVLVEVGKDIFIEEGEDKGILFMK